MSTAGQGRYDAAIVGAGPVGSLCALAHARRGARVVLLEAGAGASTTRLAGEWLHPPAVRALREFGVDLDRDPRSAVGRGFVLFPEDGAAPIRLPYRGESLGLSCEHGVIVSRLHEAVAAEPRIDLLVRSRVWSVEHARVTFTREGEARSVEAPRIVGADGRNSVVRRSLGLSARSATCSLCLGVVLRDVELPFEGYGHVMCGAPGPILLYRLNDDVVRVLVDVPVEQWRGGDRIDFVAASCANVLPENLRGAFREAVDAGQYSVAANGVKPRISYGRSDRVLVGDAAGHYHPMTAVGMTLGFGDALALAESGGFREFTTRRLRETRAPELLSMGVYEVFADHRAEAVALRRAVYRGWRVSAAHRRRTSRLLACEDESIVQLGLAFAVTAARALAALAPSPGDRLSWRRAGFTCGSLVRRLWWLARGSELRRKLTSANGEEEQRVRGMLARAFLLSIGSAAGEPAAEDALELEVVEAGSP